MIPTLLLCLSLSVTGDICDDLRLEAADLQVEIDDITLIRAYFDQQVDTANYNLSLAGSGVAGASISCTDIEATIAMLDPCAPGYQDALDDLNAQLAIANATLLAANATYANCYTVLQSSIATRNGYYDSSGSQLSVLNAALSANAAEQSQNGC